MNPAMLNAINPGHYFQPENGLIQTHSRQNIAQAQQKMPVCRL
jgi:hypothetical protein